jgi:hypothetical protein
MKYRSEIMKFSIYQATKKNKVIAYLDWNFRCTAIGALIKYLTTQTRLFINALNSDRTLVSLTRSHGEKMGIFF